jgi:very-short-patch-repair endonuclease
VGSITSEANPRIQFYRQKPIGYYIADFYAPAARLIVEVDGSQHADLTRAEHDKRRTVFFEEIGLRVLRFNDRQVLLEIDSVTEEIFRAVEENPLNPPFAKGGDHPSLEKRGREICIRRFWATSLTAPAF